MISDGKVIHALGLAIVLMVVAPAAVFGASWTEVAVETAASSWPDQDGYWLIADGHTFGPVTNLGGGGLAGFASSRPVAVALVRVADCSLVVRFTVMTGSKHVIRFLADGSTRVEDWTKLGLDAGPGLDSHAPVCDLPSTSTFSAAAVRETDTNTSPLLLSAVALLAGAFALIARGSKQSGRI